MSENRVKRVHHYSVRKREAGEFHGSGLISNHVNFAQPSPQQRPEKSIMREAKIESQTLHCMDVLSVEFVVQF